VSAWATHVAVTQSAGSPILALSRPLFLTIGVTFWSVRLAGFLFYRILQTGTDKCALPAVCRPHGFTHTADAAEVTGSNFTCTQPLLGCMCMQLATYMQAT
jgi:hypothetical protein